MHLFGLYAPHDTHTLIAFISYLAAVLLVGLAAFIGTRNLSDYVLGGRRLGGAVAALSAGASDMSAWLLMALPGLVYSKGLSQIWVSLGLIAGAYCCWRLVAKRLRIYSELAGDSLTLPAYLDNRFKDGSKNIRAIAAFATVLFFTFYIASGLYAAAVLLRLTFGLEYSQALYLGAAIVMLYTCVGGFLAVSLTDFFQGNLMLCCLLIVPFIVLNQMDSAAYLQQLLLKNSEYLNAGADFAALKLLSQLSWGLGYFGMPHILVRFMAVKHVREIPLARRVCIGWMTLSLVGAVLVGMVGALQFVQHPLADPETVFMALSKQSLVPWMMGIILAAILSSSMCSIDSQMLAASSALTEDIYRALFRKKASQKELVWIGRITVFLSAGAALYIARVPAQGIMGLVAFAWAGLGSTFAAPVVLSLYWRGTTQRGVVMGMLLGCFTALLWRFAGLSDIVYEILPATILSTLGVWLGSLWGEKPSQAVLAEYRQYEKLLAPR